MDPKYGIIGIKELKLAIVPQSAGNHILPPIDLIFFNTKTNQYEKTSTGEFAVEVLPGAGDEKLSITEGGKGEVSKRSIKLLGEDLMPIKRAISDFYNDSIDLKLKLFVLFSLVVMPLIYFGLYSIRRRKDALSKDGRILKRERAYKSLNDRARRIVKIENVSGVFREYIGDKLDVDGLALTPLDVEKLLNEKNISGDLVKESKTLLRECEMGIYGGGGSKQLPQLKDSMIGLAKRLEKEIRS